MLNTPEMKLQRAVLELALQDLTPRGSAERRAALATDATRWFESEVDAPFSFVNVATCLGFDVEAVRGALRKRGLLLHLDAVQHEVLNDEDDLAGSDSRDAGNLSDAG